jgi:hypothetical protein
MSQEARPNHQPQLKPKHGQVALKGQAVSAKKTKRFEEQKSIKEEE